MWTAPVRRGATRRPDRGATSDPEKRCQNCTIRRKAKASHQSPPAPPLPVSSDSGLRSRVSASMRSARAASVASRSSVPTS